MWSERLSAAVGATTETVLRRLAGNAFCHPLVGVALMAAFSSLEIDWLT